MLIPDAIKARTRLIIKPPSSSFCVNHASIRASSMLRWSCKTDLSSPTLPVVSEPRACANIQLHHTAAKRNWHADLTVIKKPWRTTSPNSQPGNTPNLKLGNNLKSAHLRDWHWATCFIDHTVRDSNVNCHVLLLSRHHHLLERAIIV